MTWKLTWAGQEWSSDEMTVAHAGRVGLVLGRHSWEALEPFRSPEFVRAWLIVLLAEGSDLAEVVAAVDGAPMQWLLDAVVIDEE